MFSVGSVLGQLAESLLKGEENLIEKIVGKKIEELGKGLINDLIKASPIGSGVEVAKRLGEAILEGGPTEFKRARDQWLNAVQAPALTGSASKLSVKLQKAFQIAAKEQSRPEQGHWKWSKSRQSWLNEDWKHDWRSQPRDKIGRWLPGRLKTIYIAPKVKKVRSARRRAIRKQVRESFRGN